MQYDSLPLATAPFGAASAFAFALMLLVVPVDSPMRVAMASPSAAFDCRGLSCMTINHAEYSAKKLSDITAAATYWTIPLAYWAEHSCAAYWLGASKLFAPVTSVCGSSPLICPKPGQARLHCSIQLTDHLHWHCLTRPCEIALLNTAHRPSALVLHWYCLTPVSVAQILGLYELSYQQHTVSRHLGWSKRD